MAVEPVRRTAHIANTVRGTSRFAPLPTGTTLAQGRFTVEDVLAHGENGFTYLAARSPKGSRVVVKENVSRTAGHSELTGPGSLRPGKEPLSAKPRLWKEFAVPTRFKSLHVVKVLDCFMEDGNAHLVMEHLTGTNLETRVETAGTLTLAETEQVARDLSDALGEVHAQGLLHLDIKPSNVMVTASGRAVLVDFGEAQDYVNEDPRDTVECFTREFAALELFKVRTAKNGCLPGEPRTPYGPAIGPFTDLYGLGATLFYGLTGHPPPMGPARERNPQAHNPAFPIGWHGGLCRAILDVLLLHGPDRPGTVGEFRRRMEGGP